MKMFIYTIHDIEKDDIAHPKQYFENAQLYLKKSLNLFQAITLSVPEEKYIHASTILLKFFCFSNRIIELNLSNKISPL